MCVSLSAVIGEVAACDTPHDGNVVLEFGVAARCALLLPTCSGSPESLVLCGDCVSSECSADPVTDCDPLYSAVVYCLDLAVCWVVRPVEARECIVAMTVYRTCAGPAYGATNIDNSLASGSMTDHGFHGRSDDHDLDPILNIIDVEGCCHCHVN